MKKITKYIILATLCLNFTAQAQSNKSIEITSKGIQIGQQVPDITIIGLHNYKDKNGKPATTAKISDFKGKLLVLDFWATWCSPCVAMIPKMDSLQKQFGDKVQFLSVTYQTGKEVLPFLEKFEKQRNEHYDLSVVTNEKELHKMFPHNTLPHYVWIDGSGFVRAITEHKEVSAETIKNLLQGIGRLDQKIDTKIAYDANKPFLINGNGGDGSGLLYHSTLTRYVEGMSSGYNFTPIGNLGNECKITVRNAGILQLYCLAYGGYNKFYGLNRLVLELKDTTNLISNATGKLYMNWLSKNNGFCYELIIPHNPSSNSFKLMQEDLNRFFPKYAVKTEERVIKCLVLKRTSKENKLSSAGGNAEIEFTGMGCKIRNSVLEALTTRLEVLYMQDSKYPIVNGTGYNGRIDMDIQANLSSLAQLNQQLAKYNLEFVVEDYKTDVIVFKDNPAHQVQIKI